MDPDDLLLERFVSAFRIVGDRTYFAHLDPEAAQLDSGVLVNGFNTWEPRKVRTDPASLSSVYRRVPGPFPPLFERLLLSYRWARIELDPISLLANPLGPGLDGFAAGVLNDEGLIEFLHPAGLAQFARPANGDYDPVCFATSRRAADGDCPIVRVAHEGILSHRRLEIVHDVAPSFRAIVDAVISLADKR